jgi:hypothetical protein
MATIDELNEILGRRRQELTELIPDLVPKPDAEIAGYRLGLGIRKPTQRNLLQQIFGAPDSPEESALQQYFRIRREQI